MKKNYSIFNRLFGFKKEAKPAAQRLPTTADIVRAKKAMRKLIDEVTSAYQRRAR